MLSLGKLPARAWGYFAESVAGSADDYYAGAGEAPGRWAGRGLAGVGLTAGDRVEEYQLEALYGRALHPDGDQRLGRAWRSDSVTAFDACLSAPKSVSALYAVGGAEVGGAVADAHRAAVDAAVGYLGAHAGYARRGRNGVEQVDTDGLVIAQFDHRLSRAGDPQLHTHNLILNKARCEDGRWRTLDGHEAYHHAKSAGMVYQAALRSELSIRLEVAWDEVDEHGQAELAGVPEALTELWSSRARDIEAERDQARHACAREVEDRGGVYTDRDQRRADEHATLATRPRKDHALGVDVHTRWQREATEAGVSLAIDEWLATPARQRHRYVQDAEALASDATAWRAGRQATFTRADLVGAAAAHLAPGAASSAGEVRGLVEQAATHALHQDTVALWQEPSAPAVACRGSDGRAYTTRHSHGHYVTAEAVAAEQAVIDWALAGRRGQRGIEADQAASHAARRGLDGEQQHAVAHLTGDDDLALLRAPAGAGKTTVAHPAAELWLAEGRRVQPLADASAAAERLREALPEATLPAETVAKFLIEQDPERQAAREAAADAGDETAEGQRQRWHVDAATVVLVDEAGQLDRDDWAGLARLSQATGCQVRAMGDARQLGAVAAPGGLFEALEERVGVAELATVYRQRDARQRRAGQQLAVGDPTGWQTYADDGTLREHPTAEEAREAAYQAWRADRDAGRDTLLVAARRRDVAALNERARGHDLAAGRVDAAGEVTHGEYGWAPGDWLLARRNDRDLVDTRGRPVRNGDRFAVAAADSGGVAVTRLDDGAHLRLPAAYVAGECERGYATTVHRAQGATADTAHVLASAGMDRETLHVAATRHRDALTVYGAPAERGRDTDHGPPPEPMPLRDQLAAGTRRSGRDQAAVAVHAELTAAAKRLDHLHAERGSLEAAVDRHAGPDRQSDLDELTTRRRNLAAERARLTRRGRDTTWHDDRLAEIDAQSAELDAAQQQRQAWLDHHPDVDEERQRRRNAITSREAELTDQAERDQPERLTAVIGACPDDEAARQRWRDTARLMEAYRERWHADPTAAPGSPEQRRDQHHLRRRLPVPEPTPAHEMSTDP